MQRVQAGGRRVLQVPFPQRTERDLTAPVCPLHGAMLCYGDFGTGPEKFRLYRCELGFCRYLVSTRADGTEGGPRVEYEQVTCLEFWAYYDGRVVEMPPHTLLPNKVDE